MSQAHMCGARGCKPENPARERQTWLPMARWSFTDDVIARNPIHMESPALLLPWGLWKRGRSQQLLVLDCPLAVAEATRPLHCSIYQSFLHNATRLVQLQCSAVHAQQSDLGNPPAQLSCQWLIGQAPLCFDQRQHGAAHSSRQADPSHLQLTRHPPAPFQQQSAGAHLSAISRGRS